MFDFDVAKYVQPFKERLKPLSVITMTETCGLKEKSEPTALVVGARTKEPMALVVGAIRIAFTR
jgi:hypothetical protein